MNRQIEVVYISGTSFISVVVIFDSALAFSVAPVAMFFTAGNHSSLLTPPSTLAAEPLVIVAVDAPFAVPLIRAHSLCHRQWHFIPSNLPLSSSSLPSFHLGFLTFSTSTCRLFVALTAYQRTICPRICRRFATKYLLIPFVFQRLWLWSLLPITKITTSNLKFGNSNYKNPLHTPPNEERMQRGVRTKLRRKKHNGSFTTCDNDRCQEFAAGASPENSSGALSTSPLSLILP
ncbi:uncharacterized protein LOC116257031 isoform X1 [Nymphaea colorata]|uniref:uncharacterized protein LOC116257031 isoform X1 n=1 Tax=Nymphaea colorata TaxID=210225 RepID=UPI00214E0AA6|nr:uncharacterized protein LOC116257031 isoform X1 [Nymphaea colorata]